jgi:hypothetical protein
MLNVLEKTWAISWNAGGQRWLKWQKKTVAQITTMVVAERIDKSGSVNPRRRITLDYLVERSEDQVRYYTEYW